jgi:hypothetical protein
VVCYLLALLVISRLGSFGGADALPAPVDSVLVAVVGALTYAWAVRSSREYLPPGRAGACHLTAVGAQGLE